MAAPLILTLACADRPGITARVTGFLFERNCNILDAQQFNDRAEAGGTDRFFMRVVFDPDGSTAEGLRADFTALAAEFAMEWKMAREDRPRRTIILVSKFDHCLVDLLYRWRTGELPIDPVAIVSNHPREAAIRVDIGDIPFHHIPVTPDTKPAAEAAFRARAEQGREVLHSAVLFETPGALHLRDFFQRGDEAVDIKLLLTDFRAAQGVQFFFQLLRGPREGFGALVNTEIADPHEEVNRVAVGGWPP